MNKLGLVFIAMFTMIVVNAFSSTVPIDVNCVSGCSGSSGTAGTVAIAGQPIAVKGTVSADVIFPDSMTVSGTVSLANQLGTLYVNLLNQLGTISVSNMITGFATSANQTLELSALGSLATATGQSTGNGYLSSINSILSSGTTNVSVTNQITGYSTSANQDVTNANLGTISNAVTNGTLNITARNELISAGSIAVSEVGTGTLTIDTSNGYDALTIVSSTSGASVNTSDLVSWIGSMDGVNYDAPFSCQDVYLQDGNPYLDNSAATPIGGGFYESCNVNGLKSVQIILDISAGGNTLTTKAALSKRSNLVEGINSIVFTEDIDWRVSVGPRSNPPTAANSKPIIQATDADPFRMQGTVAVSGTASVSVAGTAVVSIPGVVTVQGTTQAAGVQTVAGTVGITGGTIGISGPVTTLGTMNVKPFVTTISGTGAALNADIIASMDVSNYSAVAFTITNANASNNVQVQFGIGSFTPGVCFNAENSGTTSSKVTTIVAPGNYVCQVSGKNMRIRITAYASSILTLDGYLSSIPFAPLAVDTNSFVTGGTNYVLLKAANGNNLLDFSGALQVYSAGGTYNTQSTGGTIGVINTITNQVNASVSQFTTPWIIQPPSSSPESISLNESVAAPTAATWYKKTEWQVPNGFTFWPEKTKSTVTTAGSRTYIGTGFKMATFNTGTNAFTDLNSVTSPRFFSRMFGCVTTVLSAVADNITVTYTDNLGNTGHTTAATTFAASSPVGNCFEFTLAATTGQMHDSGFIHVTGVSDSAATTGVIEILGTTPLHDALGTANAYEVDSFDVAAILQNEYIWIMFQQAAVTAQQRGASCYGRITSP